jgi:nucleotide-binding universal stress UspA family protein
MVSHILVAVDGSGSSRHAARFAMTLAEAVHARVTLLTVLPPPALLPMGPLSSYAVLSQGLSEPEVQRLDAELKEIAADKPGVDATRSVEIGDAAETIVDIARLKEVDLIVVGARGLSPARRFLLGSVSDRVAHHAHCPVTIWR